MGSYGKALQPETPGVDLDELDRYYADADRRRWVANTSVHESTTFGNVRAFVQVSAGSAMGPPILRLEVGQDEIQSALNNARCVEHLHNSWPAASTEIRSLRSRVESRTMDLAALEGTNSANEGALRIQLERLQEQETELRTLRARVAAVRVAAKDFRDALAARQHGDVAAWKCAKRVELLFEPLGPDSCPDCRGSGEEFRTDLDVFAQCRACGGNGWRDGVRR